MLTPPPRSHLLPAISLSRRLRPSRPRLPRPGLGPLHGHSPRTAHLPPTPYRQLGTQRTKTACRLAPHPLLHHHFRGRRNVHRHGGRALDHRAPGASHPYTPPAAPPLTPQPSLRPPPQPLPQTSQPTLRHPPPPLPLLPQLPPLVSPTPTSALRRSPRLASGLSPFPSRTAGALHLSRVVPPPGQVGPFRTELLLSR
jgi:hypothetical protein